VRKRDDHGRNTVWDFLWGVIVVLAILFYIIRG